MFTAVCFISTALSIIACVVIGIIAIIRLRLCVGKHRPRLKYTLIMCAAFIGIAQPAMNDMWPGATSLALSLVVVCLLVFGTPALKIYKDKNEFYDSEIYDPEIHGDDECA